MNYRRYCKSVRIYYFYIYFRYIGELVEEAKLLQVKEDHEIKQHLLKSGVLLPEPVKQNELAAPSSENPSAETSKIVPKAEVVDKSPEKSNSDDELFESKPENPSANGDSKTKEDDTPQSVIEQQTLITETALTPYFLRLARDNYERRRKKFKMQIFN